VRSGQISQGEAAEFTAKISKEEGKTIIRVEATPQKYHFYLIFGLVVAIVAIAAIIVFARTKKKARL